MNDDELFSEEVIIVGGGYIAQPTAERLLQRGLKVRILRRNVQGLLSSVLDQFRSNGRLDVAAADVTNISSLTTVIDRPFSLIYIVAADEFSPESYDRTYVQGLNNVLKGIVEPHGELVRRVLFVSSTAVYAQADGSQVDEHSITEPMSFSGQSMLRAESYLTQWGALRNIPTTSIRFSGIYGFDRTRMINQILAGAPVSPARWKQLTNRIHRNDCAAVLDFLLQKSEVLPLYLASDCGPVTFGELATWVCQQVGQPLPPVIDGAPVDRSLERGGHKRCWSTALLAAGFSFQYPDFRSGYGPYLATIKK